MKQCSFPIKRSDEKYQRIERYDDYNFVNSIMFEFTMRNKRFLKIYNKYYNALKKLTSDKNKFLKISCKFCEMLEKENRFQVFGYSGVELINYIVRQYYMVNEPDEDYSTILTELCVSTSSSLLEYGYDPTLAIQTNKSQHIDNPTPKIYQLPYKHPKFTPSLFDTLNLCLEFNLLEPKNQVEERFKYLLDNIYETFDNKSTLYFYDKYASFEYSITKNVHPNINLTDISGNRMNIKEYMANLFFVYDARQLKMTYECIASNKNEGGIECDVTTVKNLNKKSKYYIEEKNYFDFYYKVKFSKQKIIIDDD